MNTATLPTGGAGTAAPPRPLDKGPERWRYPGSHPFSESKADCNRFFGRADEAMQLYLRVLSVTLLVHFGRSGLGKTSLLLAGLFPRLREKPLLPVLVRLNVANEKLHVAVARGIREACAVEGLDDEVDANVPGLWELVTGTMLWRDGLLLTPVLVFDQFEEVFTLRDAKFREELALELAALATGTPPQRDDKPAGRAGQPPAKLVISLREDFLGSLEEFSHALPGLFRERLRLEPMTDKAAREAIVSPAAMPTPHGSPPFDVPPFTYDDAVLDEMVRYLRGRSDVIEPFQLQLLCRHAERLAGARSAAGETPVVLKLADFTGRNAFPVVLRDFYQQCVAALPWRQRGAARRLCQDGLLDASGHRLMLDIGQIRDTYELGPDALDQLEGQRLLRRERRLESVFYEISHDRLAATIHDARSFRLSPGVRRVLITAAVLGPFLLAAGLYWVTTLRAERNRAEQLVHFLLGEDLLGQVREAGLAELLPLVADRTNALVDSDHLSLSLGLALRNRGDIALVQGHTNVAAAVFALALDNFNADAPVTPGVPTTPWREAARTHSRLGDALAEQGDMANALRHHAAASTLWARLESARRADRDDCAAWADSQLREAELQVHQGARGPARQLLGAVMDKTLWLIGVPGDGPTACLEPAPGPLAPGESPPMPPAEVEPDADALALVARAAALAGRLDADADALEGALLLATAVQRQKPLAAAARRAMVLAMVERARQVSDAAQARQGLADARRALRQLDQLVRVDPSNQPWRRDRAVAQALLGGLLVRCCQGKADGADAIPLTLEALATLRQLAQVDPTNLAWRADLSLALHMHALTQQDPDARLGEDDEAERLLQPLVQLGIRSAELAQIELSMARADSVWQAGVPRRAADAYRRIANRLDLLHKAEPEDPRVLAMAVRAHHALARLAETLDDPATVAGEAAFAAALQRTALDRRAQQRDADGARLADAGEGAAGRIRGELTASRPDSARRLALQALAVWRQVLAREPANAGAWHWLGVHLGTLAQAQRDLAPAATASRATAEPVIGLPPPLDGVAAAVSGMHAAFISRTLTQRAAPALRLARELDLSEARRVLGHRLLADQRFDDPMRAIAQEEVTDAGRVLAAELAAEVRADATVIDALRRRLLEAQFRLGHVLFVRNQPGWEEAWMAARQVADQALVANPVSSRWLLDRVRMQRALADKLGATGQTVKAGAAQRLLQDFDEALKAARVPDPAASR